MGRAIRFGVIGAGRGMSFAGVIDALPGRAELAALCDIDDKALAEARRLRPGIKTFRNVDDMIYGDDVDAVLVASPMQLHADHSLRCLLARKHVLCEVPACLTDEEAQALVRAARHSSTTYMMAENYCFMRPHMMALNMVSHGVFGELTYAEGMYLHDCRSLYFRHDGGLTWRGDIHGRTGAGNTYPTHSLGPIAMWLGIGTEDSFDTVYSVSTRPTSLADFTRRRFGDNHPFAGEAAWSRGDSTSNLIRTKRGRVISLRMDIASSRPHHMHVHELQGVKAVLRTPVDPHDPALIWIDGRSPGTPLPPPDRVGQYWDDRQKWENLDQYAGEHEHPLWKYWGEEAKKTGHGGGDLIVVAEFLRAAETGEKPVIDVYDAVDWSSIVWLSADSERLGKPVAAVDYRALG